MTDAERKAAERQRKRSAGLAPLEVWAKPSDHAAIRAFVVGLSEETDPNLTQDDIVSGGNT